MTLPGKDQSKSAKLDQLYYQEKREELQAMAITNHERVGKAIDLLKAGLGPFAEREFASAYQAKAQSQAALFLGEDRLLANKPVSQWDTAALLKLMWDAWNESSGRRWVSQTARW